MQNVSKNDLVMKRDAKEQENKQTKRDGNSEKDEEWILILALSQCLRGNIVLVMLRNQEEGQEKER